MLPVGITRQAYFSMHLGNNSHAVQLPRINVRNSMYFKHIRVKKSTVLSVIRIVKG